MRYEMNRSERFAQSGEFAPLFEQLSRPVDRAAISDGMRALALWLGSPRRRWQAGADH